MFRWRGLSALVTLAVLMAVAPIFRAVAGPSPRGSGGRVSREAAKYLEIYYTSPVLVRAGERVRMPVDVVCATASGRSCAATVTLGTRVNSEPWRLVSSPARQPLEFDLTGPASRAVGSSESGSVSFFLR